MMMCILGVFITIEQPLVLFRGRGEPCFISFLPQSKTNRKQQDLEEKKISSLSLFFSQPPFLSFCSLCFVLFCFSFFCLFLFFLQGVKVDFWFDLYLILGAKKMSSPDG